MSHAAPCSPDWVSDSRPALVTAGAGRAVSVPNRPGWPNLAAICGGMSGRGWRKSQSVTKREAEDYDDFVRRSAANPIGRRVKLADLHDNSDISRIAVPSERDLQRIEKYRRAIDLIGRIPALSS